MFKWSEKRKIDSALLQWMSPQSMLTSYFVSIRREIFTVENGSSKILDVSRALWRRKYYINRFQIQWIRSWSVFRIFTIFFTISYCISIFFEILIDLDFLTNRIPKGLVKKDIWTYSNSHLFFIFYHFLIPYRAVIILIKVF